jgi:hypothetical protein
MPVMGLLYLYPSVKNMDSKEEFGTYNSNTLEENSSELLSTLRGSSSTDIYSGTN